jgi:MFS superfamily sulfate permease-like transporter
MKSMGAAWVTAGISAAFVAAVAAAIVTALDALGQHGRRIAIVGLDGPLFFGSEERVERVVGDELSGSDWVLLDLKRMSHFDSSGVLMLKRLDEMLVRSGRRLFLAPLLAGGRRRKFLEEWGLTKPEAESSRELGGASR